jgi:tetratricopeptide (TPR) repeat protein
LCSEVWEAAYDEDPLEAPTAGAEDVDMAVEATLEQGANAFQWIWNGLPPAEKVLMATMAGSGKMCVIKDQIGEIMKQSGVDLNQGELDSALATLIRWDLLRRDGCGYRFSIPLLQRWVAENRPLRRVKAELDSTEPVAENLFANAESKYTAGDLGESERLLRRTLSINPHHVQGKLLLGHVHIGKKSPAEAVAVMESAYRTDPVTAREGLIAALLDLTDSQSDENEQWQTIGRILRIDPDHPVARTKRDVILRSWADTAAEGKNYKTALNAYEQLDDKAGTDGARRRLRLQSLTSRLLSRSEPAK